MAVLPRTPENHCLLSRERLAYARSSAVKFAIMMKLPAYRLRQDYDAVFRIAQTTDVLAPCPDAIRWWPQPKRTGGFRAICSLPLQPSLGQRIARDLIMAQFTPTERVYDWRRRGPHRYITSLGEALRTHGPHVMCMDIRSCYASVDIDAVYGLDLIPPELVRSTIDHRQLRFHRVQERDEGNDAIVVPTLMHVGDPTGPSGLLQGGPASSSLVAALLHGATESVATGIHCQSYSDNFANVGPTEEAVIEAARDLARYVTGLHSGRLDFRQELWDVRDGFEHLGFRFQQRAGEIAVTLTEQKLFRALHRLHADLEINGLMDEDDREVLVRQALAPFPCLSRHDTELLRDQAWMHAATARART
jgi:hypothetical protein